MPALALKAIARAHLRSHGVKEEDHITMDQFRALYKEILSEQAKEASERVGAFKSKDTLWSMFANAEDPNEIWRVHRKFLRHHLCPHFLEFFLVF